MITGNLVSTHREATLGSALSRLIGRGGEPLIRRGVEFAMTLLGQQFVMGETIENALERSRSNVERGFTHSFDMLGEAALTATDAERYFAAYEAAIHAIGKSNGQGVVGGDGISVKLSALHPRYVRAQHQRVMDELYPRLFALAALARDYEIGFNIDAEEADRLSISLELVERLAFEPQLQGWEGLGVVIQAYQKTGAAGPSPHLADVAPPGRAPHDGSPGQGCLLGQRGQAGAGRRTGRLPGIHPQGAYRPLLPGLRRAPARCRRCHLPPVRHPQRPYAGLRRNAWRPAVGWPNYEFQCLHGMGEALYGNVVGKDGDGLRCRIYAPVGRHETLLPYLVRRLLENGANSSFVNRIVDEKVSIDELVASPLAVFRSVAGPAAPGDPAAGRFVWRGTAQFVRPRSGRRSANRRP